MKPIKVTAHMADGRVNSYDGLFFLDSLLGWAWMLENHPDALFNQDPLKDQLIEPEVPLERRGKGDDWYWAVSVGQHEVLREQMSYWHRRVDADLAGDYVNFGKRKGKIQTKQGAYKPYRMPITEKLIPEIIWYAVGDPVEVEHLISHVSAIGKKTSQGFGQVASWSVEEIEEDWSEMKDGRLMRPLPLEENMERLSGRIMMAGIRPPYWHPNNQRAVFVP